MSNTTRTPYFTLLPFAILRLHAGLAAAAENTIEEIIVTPQISGAEAICKRRPVSPVMTEAAIKSRAAQHFEEAGECHPQC